MDDKDKYYNNTQIKRITLVDAVVAQMVNAVKVGKYKPGDKIPSEKVLAQEFGVSRTTLREAFKKLELLGAVSIRQGRGTYLLKTDNILAYELQTSASSDSTHIQDAIYNMFTIGNYQLTDFLEAREYVELSALERVIERASEQDLNKIEDVLNRQKLFVHVYSDFIQSDCDFHEAIIMASKNEFLYQFWLTLEPYLKEQISRTVQISGMSQHTYNMHNKLYNAIKQRDIKKAKKLTIDHLRILPGRLLSKVSDQINLSDNTSDSEKEQI